MKILWVSNSPIGPAARILGEKYSGTSGGWIQSEYEALDKTEAQMAFLCTASGVKKGEIIHKSNELGDAYCMRAPRPAMGIRNPAYLVRGFERIIEEVKPDVIHIWGTETCVSNIAANAAPGVPKVIFMQGLIGIHVKYLGGYFDEDRRSLVRFRSPVAALKEWVRRRGFKKQVSIERDTISKCTNVIVDSNFVADYCRSTGTDVRSFNYPLLPNRLFYGYSWSPQTIEPYSIFTVFGSNAEKGLQQLLSALRIVKEFYPGVRLRVPGSYPLDSEGRLNPSSCDSYNMALKRMIKKYGLEDNVTFLGRLDAEGMAKAMSTSHVFVNPSCMEVHALSMRECLVQGIPCVSSVCGGVLEFMRHGENGFLYRYEEYEVLAGTLCRLFGDIELCRRISERARFALDALKCPQSIMEIYKEITGNGK